VTLTGWSLVLNVDGMSLKGFTLAGEVGEGVTQERTCEYMASRPSGRLIVEMGIGCDEAGVASEDSVSADLRDTRLRSGGCTLGERDLGVCRGVGGGVARSVSVHKAAGVIRGWQERS
jgi:lipid-binding SYLF domain-containing protein